MEASDTGFQPVVLNILNRWTGLKMMVEHQMGGRDSLEKALYLVEYIVYIFNNNQSVEAEDIEDILIEFMEEQCNTTLEDDSPIEVSRTLVHLFGIYSTGGIPAAEAELRTLPAVQEWLQFGKPVRAPRTINNENSESEEEVDHIEEESDGWTNVTYGRRR